MKKVIRLGALIVLVLWTFYNVLGQLDGEEKDNPISAFLNMYDPFRLSDVYAIDENRHNKNYVSIDSKDSDDFASFVFVDKDGYIYVTGCSKRDKTSFDYVTIKYNPDGKEEWIARLNGDGNSSDKAKKLSLDKAGNVYVMGNSVMNDVSDSDYLTVKYNSLGELIWRKRFNGSGNSDDIANSLIVDDVGNVYVTGKSRNEAGDFDFATLKYDPSGDLLWVNIYGGKSGSYDEAKDLTFDHVGNLLVTGSTGMRIGAVTDFDYHTIKYSPKGEELWSASFTHPKYNNAKPTAIVSDRDGNVYVTGISSNGKTKDDFTTVKYNPNGTQEWVNRFNSLDANIDWALALDSDRFGNVYVTGWGGKFPNYDYITIKIGASGKLKWSSIYNGLGNSLDWASDIVVDQDGFVYVTGKSKSASNDYDYATLKYNSSGKEIWIVRYNSYGNSNDRAKSLAVSLDGSVYVTGNSQNDQGDQDYTTIKYNSDGEEQWVVKYDGKSDYVVQ